MPIYEYECQACGSRIEKLQKITEDPLTRCGACEADALKRLVSQTSFVLKGSGWYATDYKSPSSKPSSDAESASSTSSEKPSTSTSTDTPTKKESSSS